MNVSLLFFHAQNFPPTERFKAANILSFVYGEAREQVRETFQGKVMDIIVCLLLLVCFTSLLNALQRNYLNGIS